MIRTLTMLALLAASLAARSQPLQLSLKQAQDMAQDSSYAMRNAQFDIRSAEQEAKAVLAQGLPQISAAGQYQQFLELPVSLIPNEFLGGEPGSFTPVQFGLEYNLTGSVTATQLIFDGTYFVGLSAARTYVELSRNARLKTAAEIKLAVAQAYHSVLVGQENLKILQSNLSTIEKLLKETQSFFENGLVDEQDIDQLQLNKNQIANSIAGTERYLTLSRKSLNFAIGIPLEREVVLTDQLDYLVQVNNNPAYLQRQGMLITHPDYLLARTTVLANNQKLRAARAEYFPRLDLYLTHQENAQRNRFNFGESGQPWFPATILGLNLSVPIFSGFQRNYQMQRARVEIDRSEMQLYQTQEALQLTVKRAMADYENSLNQWETQKQSMELAKKINQRTIVKYSEGMVSSYELTMTENQMLDEQNKYISITLQLLNAKEELDKALNIY